MTRTEFLREQAVSGANKCRRTPFSYSAVNGEQCSLTERKALATKRIFDDMPIYIGPKELIVGTRTLLQAKPGNEDGHDIFGYGLRTCVPYLTEKEIETFGQDLSYFNKTHYTPDFGIILHKGIDGIMREANEKSRDTSLHDLNREFLSGIVIVYSGMKGMILRYADEAESLAKTASEDDRLELLEIARVCRKISGKKPDTFREAVQLLWFAHLGTMVENFEFINYGRLDVILGEFLKDTPKEEATQLIECLLIKMYDQADLKQNYLGRYSAQLVVTLGGVLPNGESAVNDVTMMFLDAIDKVRLPDPEFNLRLNSKNPSAFLDKAAELTVVGCNFVSYYNDDLFVKSLCRAGVPIEYARDYAFDLCQDINIPGRSDFFECGCISLAHLLMDMLKDKRDFGTFEELINTYKSVVARHIEDAVRCYRIGEEQLELYAAENYEAYFDGVNNNGKPLGLFGKTPMAPIPLLSALYHGCMENALDIAYQPYPVKEKGMRFGIATEAINSLAAIKKVVYDEKKYTLDEIYAACENNFEGQGGLILKNILWNCPKWGNDDDYVDDIAVDVLEFGLKECTKYKTLLGGQVLGGIHQPHPVLSGADLMATPEGRFSGAPVAVTLTPESGTAKNGPTATLLSAAKIDPMLIQWNFCVMINCFASVFKGNPGKENFKTLLSSYFQAGGLQLQPNITDGVALKKARLEPEKYKDLIVRLWGVSARFIDLPRELQDEMITRFN